MILPNFTDLRGGESYRWRQLLLAMPKHNALLVAASNYSKVNPEFVNLGECEVLFTLPTGVDPRDAILAALRAEETKIRAEFQKSLTEIQARIQQHLAIENGV